MRVTLPLFLACAVGTPAFADGDHSDFVTVSNPDDPWEQIGTVYETMAEEDGCFVLRVHSHDLPVIGFARNCAGVPSGDWYIEPCGRPMDGGALIPADPWDARNYMINECLRAR